MPNWCSNTVVFEGEPEAIKKIQQLFQSMAEKEKVQEKGQLPDFVTQDSGHFFDIYFEEENTTVFQYQTRWSPNLEIVQEMARGGLHI